MYLGSIRVGLRVPNYRKLCELLGEPVQAGNSKKAQFRKWEQFFAYQREGNAFVITEVFDIPKQPNDQRMKYAKDLQPILLHHLATFGNSEYTFEHWYTILGMVDGSLFDEERRESVRLYMNVSPFLMQKLVYMTAALCRRNLMNTLATLQKKQTVNYEVSEYIVVGTAQRKATKEEQTQIQQCKKQAMEIIGATSLFAVHINPSRRKSFYEALNRLYQEQHGWDRTYTLLNITSIDTHAIDNYRDLDVIPLKKGLSCNIQTAIVSQLRSECEKADQKCLDEWNADVATAGFKLDRMTTELLVHILCNEI